MSVSKEFFNEFSNPQEQSADTLNFYSDYNQIGVKVSEKDYVSDFEDEPLVSILMTTYNRQKYLQQCIQSILHQTYKNIEFIIVDDHSTDDTEKIVNEFRNSINNNIKFIKTKGKQGPGLNKRLGWNFVRGDYVIFLDDDDYFVSRTFIAKSVKELQNERSLSVVAFNSYIQLMESNRLIISESLYPLNKVIKSTDALKDFMLKMPKPNSTFPAVFDVSKLRQARILEMKILNDTQIWLRGFFAGNVLLLSDYVGVYRVHSGSIGNNLDVELILDNLDEKFRLYNTDNFPFQDNRWIEYQIMITLYYYFSNSKHINYHKIIYWIIKNFGQYSIFSMITKCIKTRIYYFLNKS